MKIIYLFLSVAVIACGLIWWSLDFNNNPLVDETVKIESGVEISIKEFSKPYSQADLLKYIKDNTSDIWNIDLLVPPAYPIMYKLKNRQMDSSEIAIWYSGTYLLILSSDDLFKDGSIKEDVLENYLGEYPSTINLDQTKSRLMILLSSYF